MRAAECNAWWRCLVSLTVMAFVLVFLFIVEDLLAFPVVSINAFRIIVEIRMMLMEIVILTGEQTGVTAQMVDGSADLSNLREAQKVF